MLRELTRDSYGRRDNCNFIAAHATRYILPQPPNEGVLAVVLAFLIGSPTSYLPFRDAYPIHFSDAPTSHYYLTSVEDLDAESRGVPRRRYPIQPLHFLWPLRGGEISYISGLHADGEQPVVRAVWEGR